MVLVVLGGENKKCCLSRRKNTTHSFQKSKILTGKKGSSQFKSLLKPKNTALTHWYRSFIFHHRILDKQKRSPCMSAYTQNPKMPPIGQVPCGAVRSQCPLATPLPPQLQPIQTSQTCYSLSDIINTLLIKYLSHMHGDISYGNLDKIIGTRDEIISDMNTRYISLFCSNRDRIAHFALGLVS